MARHCALVPSPPLKNNPKTRTRPILLAKPQMANWGQFLWKHCCVADRTCLCLIQKRIFHFFKKRECYGWWIISEGRAAVWGWSGTFWTRTWGLPFCFTDTYGAFRTVASGWSQPEQTRRACPRVNSYTSSRQAAIVSEHLTFTMISFRVVITHYVCMSQLIQAVTSRLIATSVAVFILLKRSVQSWKEKVQGF